MSKLFTLLRDIIIKVNLTVKTEKQTLTDSQKAQVLSNIGAAATDHFHNDFATTGELLAYAAKKVHKHTVSEITDFSEALSAKADLVDGKVPISQLPDNIGGGVDSWNDLSDRPFYEGKAFEDVVWNGNTEGLTAVPATIMGMQVYFYKVSDVVLTTEQLEGATLTASGVFSGESEPTTQNASFNSETVNGSFCINSVMAICVAQANDELSCPDMGFEPTVFPEKGIWFLWTGEEVFGEVAYAMAFAAPYKVVQIADRFIPDTVVRTEEKGVSVATLENGKIPESQLPSILPTVSTSDSGKFLCVDSNGNWAATTIAEWNGGSY